MTKERKRRGARNARQGNQKITRIDVHQHITDQIVKAIEAGVDEFKLPWNRPLLGIGVSIARPQNIAIGQLYRGINVVTLWVEAQIRGYTVPVFGTYKQWQDAGCQVRRGEKASLVVFYKEYNVDPEPEAEINDGKDTSVRWVAKGYWVFNAEQVDGFEMPEVAPVSPVERNARVDAFMTATGAEVRHGGQSAHYDPREDIIQMPAEGLFTGTDTSNATEAYYSTLLHETCHWTGHKSRLDRDLGMRFGKDAYAAEELIAELGAAFLCADLQVTPSLREDHAAYIDHWLKIMKADKKAVFTAAAKANQALEWLHQKQVAKAA